MAQVPFSVAAQVLQETQQLAQSAKDFSGLTKSEIEAKLVKFGVVSDKEGTHFSELLSGKKSKAHGLVGFREALEKAELIPPQPDDFFALLHRTDSMSNTTRRTDWKANDLKMKAFHRAREKAASALRELAKAMDQPISSGYIPGQSSLYERVMAAGTNQNQQPTESRMSHGLLNNFYLKKGAEIEKSGPLGSAADQMRELAEWIDEMTVRTNDGWDYSAKKR